MEYKFKSTCSLEVIEAGENRDSTVRKFSRGTVIDARIINPQEETAEYFDLELSDGCQLIGIQKSLLESVYAPKVVKMHNHYFFRAGKGTMDDDVAINFIVTISTYTLTEAKKQIKALEKKVGMKFRLTFPLNLK